MGLSGLALLAADVLGCGTESLPKLHREVLKRECWRCQKCGRLQNLQVHHQQLLSHSGSDQEQNLMQDPLSRVSLHRASKRNLVRRPGKTTLRSDSTQPRVPRSTPAGRSPHLAHTNAPFFFLTPVGTSSGMINMIHSSLSRRSSWQERDAAQHFAGPGRPGRSRSFR